MSEVKTLKDIDDATWAAFKSQAAKNNLKLGAFFKQLMGEYEKESKTFWEKMLRGERMLGDKEAEEFRAVTRRARKEYGFRT